MNKWQRYQILGVSFLVAGVGAILLPVNVDAAKSAMEACLAGGSSKAECECEAVLNSGSEKALQSFLRRYPNSDTICNATASTGLVVDRDDKRDRRRVIAKPDLARSHERERVQNQRVSEVGVEHKQHRQHEHHLDRDHREGVTCACGVSGLVPVAS